MIASPTTTLAAYTTSKASGTSTAVASAFTGGARSGKEAVVGFGVGVIGLGLAMVL